MTTNPAFPANILDVLNPKLLTLDGVVAVVEQELAPVMENGTIAIEAMAWRPAPAHEGGWEIGAPEGMGQYTILISTLSKYANRSEGRAASSILAKSIRVMLARDVDLAVQLANLSETILGSTERVIRSKVHEQRFVDGGLKGSFIFFTVTQFHVFTEIV